MDAMRPRALASLRFSPHCAPFSTQRREGAKTPGRALFLSDEHDDNASPNPYEAPASVDAKGPVASEVRWIIYAQITICAFAVLVGIAPYAPGLGWASVFTFLSWPNLLVAAAAPVVIAFIVIRDRRLRVDYGALLISVVISLVQLLALYLVR